MRYLFILGRNIPLSIAEIKSFLKKTSNNILEEKLIGNALLLELSETLDAGTVDLLGGTLGIGIVLCNVKDIDKREIYFGTANNFNYVIWDFSQHTTVVSEYLKRRFRSEELRAVEKQFGGSIKSQDKNVIRKPSSSIIHEEYFVFDNLFGRVIQKCNYKEIEKRDMQKPVRREELSISPRLAKMMINLSEVKEGETLLDCFCGIGVVMIEALNMDINAVGIDKDANAIEGARQNLQWFKFPTSSYKLLYGDSIKLKISPVNVLVSEPDFGSVLKKIPGNREAQKMISQFEKLMIGVLNNLKTSVSGKIVFTAPLINTGRERVGCDYSRICLKTGLTIEEGFPLPEFRENQIVGREIVVMKR